MERRSATLNNKNKILMLTERFFPLSARPSAQRYSAFARTITSHSREIVVITKSPISFRSEKTTMIGLNLKKEIPIFDPIVFFLYFLKSIPIIRKHSIGLIISTVPKINNAFAGFLLSKLFGIPHIIDVRDYWEAQLLQYPLNKIVPKRLVSLLTQITSFVYRTATSLITVNETLKRMLRERGVPCNRIYLIPNGIDTSLFKPCENEKCVKRLRKKYMLPYPKTVFLYAGSLSEAYKFDVVLKGISHLSKKNNFVFLIVGRPTLLMPQKRILQEIERLEVKETVKVIGPLPVDELAELQRCCDVGVIPLDDKKFWKCIITLKLFAYLASGLPVLASGPKDGELEKFLSKYEVGFFIGKPTPQRFREGFRKFLEEKSRIESMGQRGRKIAEKFYDRYALSQKIIPIINDLIDSSTPERA